MGGTVSTRVGRMVAAAGARARLRGLPFDLDAGELERRVQLGKCEATGLPFEMTTVRVSGQSIGSFTPSIDRIDPGLGYVMSNVRMVVWCFNAAKGEGTDADVLAMARALVAKHGTS